MPDWSAVVTWGTITLHWVLQNHVTSMDPLIPSPGQKRLRVPVPPITTCTLMEKWNFYDHVIGSRPIVFLPCCGRCRVRGGLVYFGKIVKDGCNQRHINNETLFSLPLDTIYHQFIIGGATSLRFPHFLFVDVSFPFKSQQIAAVPIQ